MPIIRRSDCVPLPIVVCPLVAFVMLESWVESCVALCGECCLPEAGNFLHTVHTSRHPNLQHHNSYIRTDNYRQWNAVGYPDDGHKDARNMLRYYWLPINHYLLHLVGFSFTYLSKLHGHSNIKFLNRSPWTKTTKLEILQDFKFSKCDNYGQTPLWRHRLCHRNL